MSLEVITIVALAAIPATVGVFGLVVYKIIEATQTVGGQSVKLLEQRQTLDADLAKTNAEQHAVMMERLKARRAEALSD
jgi:hypothetical protein